METEGNENKRYEERALEMLLNQLQLIQELSMVYKNNPAELAALSRAMSDLLANLHEDWVLLAKNPQKQRVLGRKGLYIRQEESEA
jgi:uncharacterized protein YecA (UPF0149 family)